MTHSPPKVKTFKENLKRTFLTHSLVPVFELMILVFVMILAVGGYFIAHKNQETGKAVARVMEGAIARYEGFLEELCQIPELVDPATSLTKRQRIVSLLYRCSVECGYEAELFILDGDANVCLSTDESITGSLKEEREKRWKILKKLEEEKEPSAISFAVNSVGSDRKLYIGRKAGREGEKTGYAILTLDSGEFLELLSGHIQRNLVVDENGWVFASDTYNFTDAVGRLDKEMPDKEGFFTYRGGFYYVTKSQVGPGIFMVSTVTDFSDSVTILTSVFLTALLVFAIVFGLAVMSAEHMASRSTADIITMNEALKQVVAGNLDAYLDINSSTEFENIGACYNEMLDSLKHQIAANRELAETVAYAQVKQLESQFNSHFLFNTLDNIRFMCKIDGDMAEFMTLSLSELLRYNASNANEKVTVEEDLKHIGTYLDIVKIRFGDRFRYEIQAEEEIMECLMPKLLLQPIIENSIKYGFGDRESLFLRVHGFFEEGVLKFVCRDDGVGMSRELLERICHNLTLPENESPHLGLYNVHRRLRLMYGEEYGIEVENREGVRIQVSLPWERSEG